MKEVFVTGQYQIFVSVPDDWSKEQVEDYVTNNLRVSDNTSSFSTDWASANADVEEQDE
jgi:adenosylcobinamide amidohydrolase